MFDANFPGWLSYPPRYNVLSKRQSSWWLVLLILAVGVSGCRLNMPGAQEATPTIAPTTEMLITPIATSYPAPAGEVEAAPTGYPAPEIGATNTAVAYPGPQQSEASPPAATIPPTVTPMSSPHPTTVQADATLQPTDAAAGAYPAPQIQVTLTSTAMGYPGPPDTPLPEALPLQGAATSSPYPGPQPSITPLPFTTQTPEMTRGVAGTATGTVIVETPTPTLSPTVVRTVFQASDPADFKLVSGRYQLLTFYATWAPDSDVMAPVIYNLEGKYGNRIGFVYLNLDDPANSIFKEMLSSRLPPAFYLLDAQGRVVDSWFGRVSLAELDSVLRTISP